MYLMLFKIMQLIRLLISHKNYKYTLQITLRCVTYTVDITQFITFVLCKARTALVAPDA